MRFSTHRPEVFFFLSGWARKGGWLEGALVKIEVGGWKL